MYTLGRSDLIVPGFSEAVWTEIKDLRPDPPLRNPFNGGVSLASLGFDDVGVTTVFASYKISQDTPLDATSIFFPFLTLTFQTDSSQNVVEIDLRRGTWYSAPGRMISVGVTYPRILDPLTNVPKNQPNLYLTVGGGRGTINGRFVATRTVVAFQGIAPILRLPIPAMAQSAVLVAPGIGPAILNQYSTSVAPGQLVSQAPLGPLERDAVPIANAGQFFDLDPAAPVGSAVQFQLA